MGNKIYENNFKMDDIRDKVAVLLGNTGVGKSSFINCITEKNECKVAPDAKSCTKKLQPCDISHNGFNFYFVDTPGLDDGEGDEKNIKELDGLKSKYPKINVFLICLKFNDNRLSNSLKKSLIKYMELFPSPSFWEHVLILRTWSMRGSRFEKIKADIKGKILDGIKNDKDLKEFMKNNNINIPSELKEFFVDSFPEDLDQETLQEFELIFDEIANIYPLYKEVQEEIKDYVKEFKEGESLFIHVKTEKIIKFKDFDGKEHETIQIIEDNNFNLDGIKPILTEVKREQEKDPRGILCWKNQFKTHYYLIKYYQINEKRKRVQSEVRWEWEPKDIEGKEILGEKKRMKLNEEYDEMCKI